MKIGINVAIDCGINFDPQVIAMSVTEFTEEEFVDMFKYSLKHVDILNILNAEPDEETPIVVKKSGFLVMRIYIMSENTSIN